MRIPKVRLTCWKHTAKRSDMCKVCKTRRYSNSPEAKQSKACKACRTLLQGRLTAAARAPEVKRGDMCKVCKTKRYGKSTSKTCATCRKSLKAAVKNVDAVALKRVADTIPADTVHTLGVLGADLFEVLLQALRCAGDNVKSNFPALLDCLCSDLRFDPNTPLRADGQSFADKAAYYGVGLAMFTSGGVVQAHTTPNSSRHMCATEWALQRLVTGEGMDLLETQAHACYVSSLLDAAGGCDQCTQRESSWTLRVAAKGHAGVLRSMLACNYACYAYVSEDAGWVGNGSSEAESGWCHVLEKAAIDGMHLTAEITLLILDAPGLNSDDTYWILHTMLTEKNDATFVAICNHLHTLRQLDPDYTPPNGRQSLLEVSARKRNVACTRALLYAGATANEPYITGASIDFVSSVSDA